MMRSDNYWEEKERRIVRQNVLARAVEMYLARAISQEEILVRADKFESWVYTQKEGKT